MGVGRLSKKKTGGGEGRKQREEGTVRRNKNASGVKKNAARDERNETRWEVFAPKRVYGRV